MASNLDLNIEVTASVNKALKNFKSLQLRTKALGKKLQNAGRSLSLFVTAPALIAGKKFVDAFNEQAQAIAQVEAGLKSTSQQAGFTSKELQRIASDLQKTTLFGDEEILKGATAQLLTFTNIAGRQFERTQKAALDLATRLDGDLKSTTIQLGKALNDPIKNLSALSRSGIQFSEEQTKLIKSLTKTNRIAEAQTIILDELEKQYGGSAEAAAKAGLGPLKQLQNSLGDVTEELGKRLAPFIIKIAKYITSLITKFNSLSEETKSFIVFAGVLATALGPALIILGKMIGVIASLAPLVSFLAGAFSLLSSHVTLTIAGIAALAGVLYIAYKRLTQYKKAGVDAFNSVKLVLLDYAKILNFVYTKGFQLYVNGAIRAANLVTQAFAKTANFIKKQFGAEGDVKIKAIDLVEFDGFDEKISQLRQGILDANGVASDAVQDPVEALKDNVGNAINFVKDKFQSVKDGIVNTFSPAEIEPFKKGLEDVKGTTGGLKEEVKTLGQELKESLPKQAASGLTSALKDIAEGSEEAGESFKKFANTFLKNIAQMITQALILKAIETGINSFGSSDGGGGSATTGAATGGFVNGDKITHRYADGGMVKGKGGPTSDSILARLSNGEFVSDAFTVRAFGPDFFLNLKRLARGRLPKFAEGGYVGNSSDFMSRLPSNSFSVNIENQGAEKQATRVEEKRTAEGIVYNIILEDISKNGPLSKGLQNTYGLRRGAKK